LNIGTDSYNFGKTPAFIIITGVNKSEKLRMASYIGDIEEERITFRVLRGEHKELRPFGRPGRRLNDNNKLDL
jgi:hypothetical protein